MSTIKVSQIVTVEYNSLNERFTHYNLLVDNGYNGNLLIDNVL